MCEPFFFDDHIPGNTTMFYWGYSWTCVNSSHNFHFLLFQLCEIDLRNIVPAEALTPFIDEIKKREKQRKKLAKKV